MAEARKARETRKAQKAQEAQENGWVSSDERRELGAALRRLLDVVVKTSAGPADIGAAAAAIDRVTAQLTGPAVPTDHSIAPGSYREQMALVGGPSHPIAPQLRMTVHGETGEGTVVIGPLFQGGPGLVHGGILALLIDHALGCVAARADRPVMTAGLDLRYRRPTPLGVPLLVSARLDRVDGRKLYLSATISADGAVTVEADAIFLTLTERNLQAAFPSPG
jgi:acyl-coenzyme A thioesterase PaaI-like protein